MLARYDRSYEAKETLRWANDEGRRLESTVTTRAAGKDLRDMAFIFGCDILALEESSKDLRKTENYEAIRRQLKDIEDKHERYDFRLRSKRLLSGGRVVNKD